MHIALHNTQKSQFTSLHKLYLEPGQLSQMRTVTRLWAGFIPGRLKTLFSFSKCLYWSWGPASLQSEGQWLYIITSDTWCLDSICGIATHYGLDDPGIKSRCQQDCQHPTGPALGPTQPPIQWILCLFPGGKVARALHWPHTSI